MIVAFFGKEILTQFVASVQKPSVVAAEFEFFDVITVLSGYFQSLVIYLYRLYSEFSQILRNVVICAWFSENKRCDPAHIFDVIHEHFM